MRLFRTACVLAAASVSVAAAASSKTSVIGLQNLVQRRIPEHAKSFTFVLSDSLVNSTGHDAYTVSTPSAGRVKVESSTLIGLAAGLHRYLADVVHVDIYWYIGSRLHATPATLPSVPGILSGASVVPYRYHLNTVTFDYLAAFWTWEDWELELDWMALRGVNLPLAWVGYEKIFVSVMQDIGLTDAEINDFLSGPAFQAWNRFGNIKGSWGGSLPQSWIDGQHALQKKIVARMVELGMTPVLPAFTGFVPWAITRVLPNATVVNGSAWYGVPEPYTSVTFLEPFDDTYAKLQKSFIAKQNEQYGDISSIYALDQYNENNPYSDDPAYLKNISHGTWQSLKQADPNAVWIMQGWLFFFNTAFWTNERIEAYLSGVEDNKDMIILDLFSESFPAWKNTNSYFGKPWIWCQLHNFGGSMTLYGQVMNVTVNPIEALAESNSLVGFGLTPESQEGNEIMYDLLLDQAWSATPINTVDYFHDWVTTRYAGCGKIPADLYSAWATMGATVYNNTDLDSAPAVPKGIYEYEPSTTGLVNRTVATGGLPTTINYDPAVLVHAWNLMYNAMHQAPALLDNPSFQYDMVDVTRQVLVNAFQVYYLDFLAAARTEPANSSTVEQKGDSLVSLLKSLDQVLLTNENFLLSARIKAARKWAPAGSQPIADFYEYNMRNQVTLWGTVGQISDYASKSWGGLVGTYHAPRWRLFVDYVNEVGYAAYNAAQIHGKLFAFEQGWQTEKWGSHPHETWGTQGTLIGVLKDVKKQWPAVFA